MIYVPSPLIFLGGFFCYNTPVKVMRPFRLLLFILLTPHLALADPPLRPDQQAPLQLWGGFLQNISDLCARNQALSVQFLGPVSPRVEVAPGARMPISLATGYYQMAVYAPDGVPLETPLVKISGAGYVFKFGCQPFAVDSGPSADPKKRSGLAVQLANTTDDCGSGKTVLFLFDGEPVATVRPGHIVDAQVPPEPALFEVVTLPDTRRVLVVPHQKVERGMLLFYGCTDPRVLQRKEGILVIVENLTNKCPEPIAITLWVDGGPWLGVLAGQSRPIFVPKGSHHFLLREGLSLNKLLESTRDVQRPFKISYGCNPEE